MLKVRMRRWARRSGRELLAAGIGAVLALGLAASKATASPPRTPDPRDGINVWEGHWKIQSQRKDTAYSHAASVSFDADCSWMPNRGYMVCDYLSAGVDPAEGKPVNHLTIFTYDDKDKAYKHLGISQDYKTLEEATTVDGNLWQYIYEVTGEKGEKLQRRDQYEFVSPNKQSSRFEISADGGRHWTLVSEGLGVKVR